MMIAIGAIVAVIIIIIIGKSTKGTVQIHALPITAVVMIILVLFVCDNYLLRNRPLKRSPTFLKIHKSALLTTATFMNGSQYFVKRLLFSKQQRSFPLVIVSFRTVASSLVIFFVM